MWQSTDGKNLEISWTDLRIWSAGDAVFDNFMAVGKMLQTEKYSQIGINCEECSYPKYIRKV